LVEHPGFHLTLIDRRTCAEHNVSAKQSAPPRNFTQKRATF